MIDAYQPGNFTDRKAHMTICKNCGAALPVGRTYCDNTCRKAGQRSFASQRAIDVAVRESRRLDRLINSSRRNSPFSAGRKTGI